jgi:beta-barrel assembly-enhancing protease
MKFINLCLVFSAGFLVSSCANLPQNFDLNKLSDLADLGGRAVSSVKGVDEKEEIAIGRQSTAVLLGALSSKGISPIYQKKAQHYVNKVGRHLANHSSRSKLKWYFVVSNDPDINAFAAPGGYIIITKGLLQSLNNEAQLAAVLAHEIVHVEEKHHLKTLQKNGLLSLAADVGVMALEESGQETLNPKVAEQVLNASRTLYAKGLDKEDEYAADKRAMTLLNKSGYDAFALIDVLQMLDAKSANDSQLALLCKTHPTARARMEKLSLLEFNGTGLLLSKRFSDNKSW